MTRDDLSSSNEELIPGRVWRKEELPKFTSRYAILLSTDKGRVFFICPRGGVGNFKNQVKNHLEWLTIYDFKFIHKYEPYEESYFHATPIKLMEMMTDIQLLSNLFNAQDI